MSPKLTAKQVKKIQDTFAKGKTTLTKLAIQFNVTPAAIAYHVKKATSTRA